MSTPEGALRTRVDEETSKLIPQARAEARKAWQRAPHALDLGEMESLALLGLAQAAARWPAYCDEKGHDPWAFHYFTAFCLRRIRGAMLDAMRKLDWVSRAERTKAKAIQAAGQSAPLTEAEVAEVTGMPVEEVRAVLALVSARPVSMDAEPVTVAGEDDVESSALVSGALRAAERAVRALPLPERNLVLLRHVYGLPAAQAAAMAGVPPAAAPALLQSAARQVREALAHAMGVALGA